MYIFQIPKGIKFKDLMKTVRRFWICSRKPLYIKYYANNQIRYLNNGLTSLVIYEVSTPSHIHKLCILNPSDAEV